jgi:hypothetical protein
MVEIAIAARYAITRTRFNILPLLNLDATGTTGARLFIGNDPPSYAGRPCAVSRPAGKLAGGDLAKCDLVHDGATLLEAPCNFVRSNPLAYQANFLRLRITLCKLHWAALLRASYRLNWCPTGFSVGADL